MLTAIEPGPAVTLNTGFPAGPARLIQVRLPALGNCWARAAATCRLSEVDQASRLAASDLREALGRDRPPVILDVRNAGERAAGAGDGSLHIPLAELPSRLSEIPAGTPVVVYCAAGSRSSIAASLLRRHRPRRRIRRDRRRGSLAAVPHPSSG